MLYEATKAFIVTEKTLKEQEHHKSQVSWRTVARLLEQKKKCIKEGDGINETEDDGSNEEVTPTSTTLGGRRAQGRRGGGRQGRGRWRGREPVMGRKKETSLVPTDFLTEFGGFVAATVDF
eukprot:2390351-Ditylum_brightwellii.AAC.1